MSSTPSPIESPDRQPHSDKQSSVPLGRMPRALLGRRWRWATLVVILGMLFLGRLGVWQLDRLEQRRAANAAFEAQFYDERIDLNGPLPSEEPEALIDRQAVVSGRFDYAGQIVLTAQNFQDRPGAHLVTPFLIDGKDEAILVDRGWIPADEAERPSLEAFNEYPEGPLAGVLKGSQTLSGGRETIFEPGQTVWYRIDIAALQTQYDYQLLPVYLWQTPTAAGSDGLPIREEVELDLSEGSHLSYAIQWFLFALVLGVLYGRYVQTHDGKRELEIDAN